MGFGKGYKSIVTLSFSSQSYKNMFNVEKNGSILNGKFKYIGVIIISIVFERKKKKTPCVKDM